MGSNLSLAAHSQWALSAEVVGSSCLHKTGQTNPALHLLTCYSTCRSHSHVSTCAVLSHLLQVYRSSVQFQNSIVCHRQLNISLQSTPRPTRGVLAMSCKHLLQKKKKNVFFFPRDPLEPVDLEPSRRADALCPPLSIMGIIAAR